MNIVTLSKSRVNLEKRLFLDFVRLLLNNQQCALLNWRKNQKNHIPCPPERRKERDFLGAN